MAKGGFNPQTDEPKYQLTELFTSGFQNKLEEDEVPNGSAVAGSKNFIVDDDGKWVTRPGSEYFGTLSTLPGEVTSSGRLRRRDGTEIPLIAHDQYLRYYHPTLEDWVVLQSFWTPDQVFGFAPVDLSTDPTNSIVHSNGVDNYGIFLGAFAVVDTYAIPTVTIEGSTSLADLGFTATGNFSINGYEHSYTGISGTSFTGVTLTVTPVPALSPAPGPGVGLAHLGNQYASAPKGNILLATANARVLVANVKPTTGVAGGGQVYGSKTNDPSDFSFSAPRLATDGFIQNLPEGGGTVTGLAQFEENYFVFKAGCIQRMTFSQDGNDIIQVRPLNSYDERTSSDFGSVSAKAVFRLDNSICFVTPTNIITTISRVDAYDYVQTLPISDAIKNTVDTAQFDTSTAGIAWRGRAFIACKKNSQSSTNDMLLTYNQRYKCWDTPTFGLNISTFFVTNGKLYAGLANSPDVIELWTGTVDFLYPTQEAIPITAELRLNRQNFGTKSERKTFRSYYIEGEMTQTGNATFQFQYNEAGDIVSGTLQGTETGFFFVPDASGAFGTDPFGVETFTPSGDDVVDANDPIRFRLYLSVTEYPFWNYQFRIQTSNYFKLIAHGPAPELSEDVIPGVQYKAAA